MGRLGIVGKCLVNKFLLVVLCRLLFCSVGVIVVMWLLVLVYLCCFLGSCGVFGFWGCMWSCVVFW